MATFRPQKSIAPLLCAPLCSFLALLLVSPSMWAADRAESEASQPSDSSPSVGPGKDFQQFLEWNCIGCHSGSSAEAGFDLTALGRDLSNENNFDDWVHVFDRVRAGEMPPEDFGAVDPDERDAFLGAAGSWLTEHQRAAFADQGRVRGRRLSSRQLERTLHDLLGIDIPLGRYLPSDARQSGFSTYVDNQSTSHFHLQRHLTAVDAALDEAFDRALGSDDYPAKELSAKELARTRRRTREPELIDGRIVVWSGGVTFYGRIPATTAREDGWYRFTIRGIEAINKPEDHGVWCTIHSGQAVSSAPLLTWVGGFEATDEPKEFTIETWLPKGKMLEIRPGDATLKRGRFKGGQVETGEGAPQEVPGVAIDSITMQQIHRGPDSGQIRKWLFGDLEIEPGSKKEPATLVSESPKQDARRLLMTFAERAFRRPVDASEVERYVQLVEEELDSGTPLLDALRLGYRALLCSPRFVYFTEDPGQLDDYELASRLSYMLYGSMPDDELMQLAKEGRLSDPKVLRKQVDRILESPRGSTFIRDFAAEWLDLDQIDSTQPDRRMFRQFDPIVQNAMLDETHAYLDAMLKEDLSVDRLIDSDFTFLNSRLARFYGIDGVDGDSLQRCELPAESRRGGLLTQGAILKVTANGTTTSPVIRGVWVSERLLGVHVPPPPDNVPAIEPDIRGATSIRDMLEKHRADPSCASCHEKVDPAGFALENFDAVGRWRDQYGRRGREGVTIDASYSLPDGREFEDIDGFQELIVADSSELARNVVRQMIGFGTGRRVEFVDRKVVDDVVAAAAESDYGFRSLLKGVITSSLFRTK